MIRFLSTNGSCVIRPDSKPIEQVRVPAMNNPGKQVLTPKHVHIIAQTEDYFRERYHPKLTSLPMQYEKDKPPIQCFVKLLSLWADIEPPTEGRKTPH